MTVIDPGDNCIIIERNKLKLGLLLLVSIGFGIGGFFFVSNPTAFVAGGVPHTSPLFVAVVGTGALILCIAGLIISTRRLIGNSPGLKIDNEGITMYGLSKNFVPWRDILKFEIHEDSHANMIGIWLADAEKRIAEQKDSLKQKLMVHNYQHAGAALNINVTNLKCSIADLNSLLMEKLTYYQQSTQPAVLKT